MRGGKIGACKKIPRAVVVEPPFSRLETCNNWMSRGRVMFRSVLIRRTIDVTALGASAKMQPPIIRPTSSPEPIRLCWRLSTGIAARASRRSPSSMSMCTPAARRWSARSRSRGEGIDRNQRIKPMQSRLPMHHSPRCGARTRSRSPCQSPAMPNGRCRMHGGKSPGAPKGNRNALKDGHYTAEATARRREIASLLRSMRRHAKEAE
jgi:hypothetical protein